MECELVKFVNKVLEMSHDLYEYSTYHETQLGLQHSPGKSIFVSTNTAIPEEKSSALGELTPFPLINVDDELDESTTT